MPTVFVDASAFESPDQSLHFKLLTESVAELELLEYDRYLELTQDAVRREWFAGSLTELVVAGGDSIFGVTIWNARLRELGASLFDISAAYPIDEQVPPTADVLLDTEWKLRSYGRLAIKQVRPFLD